MIKRELYGKVKEIAQKAGVNRQTIDRQLNNPKVSFRKDIWHVIICYLLFENNSKKTICEAFNYWFRRSKGMHIEDKRDIREVSQVNGITFDDTILMNNINSLKKEATDD